MWGRCTACLHFPDRAPADFDPTMRKGGRSKVMSVTHSRLGALAQKARSTGSAGRLAGGVAAGR